MDLYDERYFVRKRRNVFFDRGLDERRLVKVPKAGSLIRLQPEILELHSL